MRYLLVGMVLAFGFVDRSGAHEWYPTYCCNDKDCHVAEQGDVKEVAGGFLIKDRWFRAYNQSPPSPDGKYHYCIWNDQLRCFYAPMPTY